MILGLSFDKELWIPFVASNCLKFLAVPVSSSHSFYDGWDHDIIIFVFLRYYVLLELSITLNLNKICSLLFQLTINLMLVSFDEQSIPSLERPYLCCKPTLSVRQLRKVFVFLPYTVIFIWLHFTKSFYYHYWNWFSIACSNSMLLSKLHLKMMKLYYIWWMNWIPKSTLQPPRVKHCPSLM